MKKLLIVEDDENKRAQLLQFIKGSVRDTEIAVERSLNSGIKRIRLESFDLIILDMTLPTYDASPDEPSDDTHIFGGREFLSQMDRFDVATPVIVFTQFELFGKAPKVMRIEDLDRELMSEFSEKYLGAIYYHASLDGWKIQLKSILKDIGFHCEQPNA